MNQTFCNKKYIKCENNFQVIVNEVFMLSVLKPCFLSKFLHF